MMNYLLPKPRRTSPCRPRTPVISMIWLSDVNFSLSGWSLLSPIVTAQSAFFSTILCTYEGVRSKTATTSPLRGSVKK